MQVKVKTEKAQFTPVVLEITFNTPDELKALEDLLRRDLTIPAVVYPEDKRSQRVLSGMMQQLFEAIGKKEGN